MKRARQFDDILNECIGWILKGVSVETCLKAFPEYAAKLEPLLRTAAETREAAAVKPSPEFRQRAGYEFQAAIRDMKPKRRASFKWQVRLVTVLSLVFVVLAAGTGTVATANNSLPDEPLYTVKLVTEDMRLTLTTSALGKAELYAEFTDKRVNEIVQMAEQGKVAQVEKATERMNDQLGALANLPLPGIEVAAATEGTSQPLMNTAATGAEQAPAVATGESPQPLMGKAPAGPEQAPVVAPTLAATPPAVLQATPVPTTTSIEGKRQPAPTISPEDTGQPEPTTISPEDTGQRAPTMLTPEDTGQPEPAPISPEDNRRPAPSANITSHRATAIQETKLTRIPAPAVTNTVKSESPEKRDNANMQKQQEELKNTVSQRAEKNTQQLEDVLKRVPDNVKPALRKAIDVAGKGYDGALKNFNREK